jgi:hypothetical protein
MTPEKKQARLDRLNNAPKTVRSSSKELIAAQRRIDRFCSTRLATAVAAGRILKSEAEVLSFVKLPGNLMGQADLADVHDEATLTKFLAENSSPLPLPSEVAKRARIGA